MEHHNHLTMCAHKHIINSACKSNKNQFTNFSPIPDMLKHLAALSAQGNSEPVYFFINGALFTAWNTFLKPNPMSKELHAFQFAPREYLIILIIQLKTGFV